VTNCFPVQFRSFVSHIAALRSFTVVPQFPAVIRYEIIATSVDRKLLVYALLPHNHERHADRECGDPRGKSGFTFEPIETDKNVKKGILESIPASSQFLVIRYAVDTILGGVTVSVQRRHWCHRLLPPTPAIRRSSALAVWLSLCEGELDDPARPVVPLCMSFPRLSGKPRMKACNVRKCTQNAIRK
jgi:hypothetical protein